MSEDDTTLLIAEIDAAAALLAKHWGDIDPAVRPSVMQLGHHLAHIRRTMVQEQQRTAERERGPSLEPKRVRGWDVKRYAPIGGQP